EVGEGAPGDLFHFFSPTMLGLQVSQESGGVRVTAIAQGTLFGKSAVRVGDFIVSVDGSRIETTYDVRLALRRAVLRNETTLILRRGADQVAVDVWVRDK